MARSDFDLIELIVPKVSQQMADAETDWFKRYNDAAGVQDMDQSILSRIDAVVKENSMVQDLLNVTADMIKSWPGFFNDGMPLDHMENYLCFVTSAWAALLIPLRDSLRLLIETVEQLLMSDMFVLDKYRQPRVMRYLMRALIRRIHLPNEDPFAQ